jgi:uncharacterized protein YyaL (SSP411 family)
MASRRDTNNRVKHLIFNAKSRIAESVWDLQQIKPSTTILTAEDMIQRLDNQIQQYLTKKDVNGGATFEHIRTWSHSETAHYLLTQKTAALAYFNMYELKKDKKYLDLAMNIVNYTIEHQEPSGIFLMHNHPYLAQDEGPTTAGVIKSLIYAYKFSKDKKYLDHAQRAGSGVRNTIYHEKFGYIHTLGQELWCTNINSSFAHSYLLLYKETGDERYLNWARDGIKFTLKAQESSGLFIYSKRLQHIFRSLYQALVLLTLIQYNELDENPKIAEAVDLGIKYAYTLQREDGSIKEPHMTCYSFLQSCTRFAHLFKQLGAETQYKKLEKYMSKFYVNNKIFLEQAHNGLMRYGFRKRYIEANYVRMLEDLANVELCNRNK